MFVLAPELQVFAISKVHECLAAGRDRAQRHKAKDQRVLAEVDEPRPGEASGFEHRLVEYPAQRRGHDHADDAVWHAVEVADAEKGCAKPYRLDWL